MQASEDRTFVPRGGSKPKYPYDKWLDGKPKILEQGIDYPEDTKPSSVVESIRKWASRYGIVFDSHLVNGEVYVNMLAPPGTKQVKPDFMKDFRDLRDILDLIMKKHGRDTKEIKDTAVDLLNKIADFRTRA